ncbi:MAG: glutamate formimidoyltransferase [Candidatus Aminicenantes bacterium]|nr:glutamate formimidoyltransferase [Candidatus Aminicenantes bacterium]
MKLVECVPNFSEGRDKEKIQAICREIESTPGVKLLDVDPGESTNRTVVTFVGPPEAVKEAAFKAIKKAAEIIDMSQHKGAHPRIGATDVCPFVPVSGVTMEECVQLANELGERVGRELGIPVYLYEEAARRPERKNLANIRSGEYEGLPEKLKNPDWFPDYGPAVFNPKTGATVIGAREFLIAYNINLNTRDKRLAQEIALNLRETGRAKRDENGQIVRGADGRPIMIPGKFKFVKAVGWYIEDYGCAQISLNLTNYKISPPHLVFEEAVKEAEQLGLRVTGSEVVGLIPKEALLMAGRYFLEKQGKSPGVPEEELIHIAIRSLGLNDVAPFDPKKKIIEYRVEESGPFLFNLSLRQFVNEISMETPTPGGGSVAAYCGALAAALTSMVANLTYGRKEYETEWPKMKEVALLTQKYKDEFLRLVDEDTKAFNRVIEAIRLPKTTEDQIKIREETLEKAYQEATLVPLEGLRLTRRLLDLIEIVLIKGNKNSISDAGVALMTNLAAAQGTFYNVKINLPNIHDENFRMKAKEESHQILAAMEEKVANLKEILFNELGKEGING